MNPYRVQINDFCFACRKVIFEYKLCRACLILFEEGLLADPEWIQANKLRSFYEKYTNKEE